MKQLGRDFTVEVDTADETRWSAIIREFTDTNIYQTWAYEVERSGPTNVSHVVLIKDTRVVAAVQARIVRLRHVKMGIAYIRWGPLWKTRNSVADEEIFRQVVRAVRNEYVVRRGLAIRLVSQLCDGENNSHRKILEEEGYLLQQNSKPFRTILMDIRPPLEDLYRGFHQKWRNCLNSARKQHLEVIEGEADALFEAFEPIYTEMKERKRFVSYTELSEYRRIQKSLLPDEKMKVALCKVEGEVCAGAICSALGDTGIYIFGATSNRGMKTNGSYLVQWRVLEWLKHQGCLWYNLNGINPAKNEGTYRFKSRFAGVHGRDVCFLGLYDAYPNAAVRLTVRAVELLRTEFRRVRRLIAMSGRTAPTQSRGDNSV